MLAKTPGRLQGFARIDGATGMGESDAAGPRGTLTVRVMAMPADANPAGDIFGGWIMGLMDVSAGIAARDRAQGRVVTASVSSLSFLHPVKVGDVVCCYTELTGLGRSSLRLDVEAWVVRGHSGSRFKVTEANFVMVAVDAAGRPRPVEAASLGSSNADLS